MKTTATLFFIWLMVAQATACDCLYNGPFNKVAYQADFVALVEVKRHIMYSKINNEEKPLAMEIDIITKYRGKETKETVRVWGDNGFLCRPYINTFAVGKKFVLALYKSKPLAITDAEKQSDYFIDACGGYWLSVGEKETTATGDYNGTIKQVSMQDLQKQFNKKS